MPTINKPNKGKYNPTRERNDLDRKRRQKIYQSPLWKRLRDSHLMEHPLCEVCELEGKITLAEHCHHLHTFMDGRNELEQKTLAFDPNNLCSVCSQCHNRLHLGDLRGCKSLDDIKQYIKTNDNSLSTNNQPNNTNGNL